MWRLISFPYLSSRIMKKAGIVDGKLWEVQPGFFPINTLDRGEMEVKLEGLRELKKRLREAELECREDIVERYLWTEEAIPVMEWLEKLIESCGDFGDRFHKGNEIDGQV